MKKFITVIFLAGSLAAFAQSPLSNPCSPKLFGVNLSGGEFGSQLPGTYGTDYTYPNAGYEYKYFSGKNLPLIRLPIQWERVQGQASGALTAFDIGKIKAAMDTAQKYGARVFLDVHNFGRYYNTALTLADTTKLADLWQKLASQFSSHPALYAYELMNEPHDLPGGASEWVSLAQAAVNGIRKADASHYIMVPGYSWQSADLWPGQSDGLKNIKDPSDVTNSKIIYTAHCYFDNDASGTYSSACSDTTVGATRVNHFINWLVSHNAKGMLTEYGAPDDPCWKSNLNYFLTTLMNSSQITGGCFWSAGPWWGNYILSVEPNSNGTNNHGQMNVLLKYPSVTCSATSDQDDFSENRFEMFPNPCAGSVNLRYAGTENREARIALYDISGREVRSLITKQQAEGMHGLSFNTQNLENGIYFLKLTVDGKECVQKLLISKN